MEKVAQSPNSPYSGSVYSPQSAEYMHQDASFWVQPNRPSGTLDGPRPIPNNNPPPPPPQEYVPPSTSRGLTEQPNFSPFPALRNPPPNIPPTDDQKEATLEAARIAVLECNDPEVQLQWAQDALIYVEVAQQNEQRISLTQPPRPRTPRVEHVLREDAMKIVNFLADQHHPKAEFMRGMWLEFGKFGHRVDKKEAFHCYTRASERGYTRADYRIGMQFESSNDALKAIKYYQRGAEAGDAASCYRLGMMTLLGQHGQAQDYEYGLNLIYSSAKAADENAPQGAYVLGMLQAHEMPQIKVPERYLPKDIAGAKINIEKAAFLGFAKAQVKMGSAYEFCELDCEFSPALSLHYNALAARQGEPEAEMAISKWFLCGHEGLFDKSEEIAFTYAQRAAVSGLATAQFAMGYYYEVGIYVPVNFERAKEWYRQASQNGNQDASGRVEAISRSKTLSRKDHESLALSKIRQQYGSRGQGRPPPLPALSESVESQPLDMPDPSRLNLNTRPPSTRPPSTAPYPTGISNMPSANHAPDFRPASAFGINPNLRPSSAASFAGSRPDGAGRQQLAPQQGYYPRFNPGPAYGREGRIPSAPPFTQGPPPPNQPPSRPGTTSPYMPPSSKQKTPPPPMKIDIGYAAPLDLSGPDRRPRPPLSNEAYSRKPHPPLPGPGGNPPRTSSRPTPGGQGPVSNGGPQNNNARPPPRQTLPQVKPANLPPSKPPANSPSSFGPPAKPTSVAPATANPPRKGPKTFDEMGVPAGKDRGECVSDSLSPLHAIISTTD